MIFYTKTMRKNLDFDNVIEATLSLIGLQYRIVRKVI